MTSKSGTQLDFFKQTLNSLDIPSNKAYSSIELEEIGIETIWQDRTNPLNNQLKLGESASLIDFVKGKEPKVNIDWNTDPDIKKNNQLYVTTGPYERVSAWLFALMPQDKYKLAVKSTVRASDPLHVKARQHRKILQNYRIEEQGEALIHVKNQAKVLNYINPSSQDYIFNVLNEHQELYSRNQLDKYHIEWAVEEGINTSYHPLMKHWVFNPHPYINPYFKIYLTNQARSRLSQKQIVEVWTDLQENGTMPTKAEIIKVTGMSKNTVKKHSKALDLDLGSRTDQRIKLVKETVLKFKIEGIKTTYKAISKVSGIGERTLKRDPYKNIIKGK